ncbi:MAG: hypothetical protein WCC65_15460, partial [Pseudonocardiaceae bacterium]
HVSVGFTVLGPRSLPPELFCLMETSSGTRLVEIDRAPDSRTPNGTPAGQPAKCEKQQEWQCRKGGSVNNAGDGRLYGTLCW